MIKEFVSTTMISLFKENDDIIKLKFEETMMMTKNTETNGALNVAIE